MARPPLNLREFHERAAAVEAGLARDEALLAENRAAVDLLAVLFRRAGARGSQDCQTINCEDLAACAVLALVLGGFAVVPPSEDAGPPAG